MGKMKSRARQLRLDLASKLGRTVSTREVAEAIDVDRRVVMKIESNEMERPDLEIMAKLATFYHDQGLDARHIVEYDPNGQRGLDLAGAYP
jgi:transcriptional regulator with XRE-family HTH domain